jgi:hypothetical protein
MSQQQHPAWVPVSSSAIESVAYDAGTQSLYVRFLPSGAEYVYSNVTQDEYFALTTAGSVGKCFNQTIKPAKEFRKLGDEHE